MFCMYVHLSINTLSYFIFHCYEKHSEQKQTQGGKDSLQLEDHHEGEGLKARLDVENERKS